ncbi:MAG: type II toxin-antitoxin system RelB/DinJ family antitoxin [Atopobiaceae bacterium]|jgi:addiction module RelB/DinJ family antitoxin|nr:type II toxin-antitoxin system RelB/DinJ family antitoxin [Atopobiaceae bacterium]MCI2173576.1 type II toxin-antitoxin system RelB/DinJ family antitoxin [Atopobiaceae bacterium]MCI2207782.1 type II toxin-antitoxin system RelB/DinJ family antitoxin [Atopobiaceae bacterium]
MSDEQKPKGRSSVTTTVRLDPETKRAAGEVFRSLGLNFNSGVDIYLRAVARTKAIPFDLALDSSDDDQDDKVVRLRRG